MVDHEADIVVAQALSSHDVYSNKERELKHMLDVWQRYYYNFTAAMPNNTCIKWTPGSHRGNNYSVDEVEASGVEERYYHTQCT